MQIRNINNINFQGLWYKGQKQVVGHTKDDLPVWGCSMTYHPFKNESKEQIQNEMEKKHFPLYECYVDNKRSYPYKRDHYVIVKYKLGESLGITEKEYKKILQMQKGSWFSDDKIDYQPSMQDLGELRN